jgi:hypothetical protein
VPLLRETRVSTDAAKHRDAVLGITRDTAVMGAEGPRTPAIEHRFVYQLLFC